MTLYHNRNTQSPITKLECVAPGGKDARETFTFCYLNDPERAEEAKQLLVHFLPHQKLAGMTQVDGRAVVILRGNEQQSAIIAQLRGPMGDFAPAVTSKTFDPWKWRGMLSNAGQSLQIVSAAFKNKKGFDSSVLGFAVFNLAANMINVVFGAEDKPDIHRLRELKTEFNAQLAPYLAETASLPDPEATITHGRVHKKTEAVGDAIYGFLKRNSVVFGEIGLRYVGAFNLAFPIVHWAGRGHAAFHATQGPLSSKLKAGMSVAAKNFRNRESLVFYSGIAYLVGKTIALFSMVPDPYDPKPPSTLDTIREKVLFKVSTVIETLAAGTLAVNGLKLGKVTEANPEGARLFTHERSYSGMLPGFMKHEKFITRDWFGAAGGALFTGGLAIRFAAPFGSREVNMKELYAHVAQGLAQVPEAKLSELLADSATAIQSRLSDRSLAFGDVYASLVQELEHYHHIRVLSKETTLASKRVIPLPHESAAAAMSPERPSSVIDTASSHISFAQDRQHTDPVQRSIA